MDYEAQVSTLRDMVRRVPCTSMGSAALWSAADTIEALSKQLHDLQILRDMYGGEDGITAAFQKAAERDAAVEDLRGMCWCCAHGEKWDKAPVWSRMTTCEHMRKSGALARGGGKCRCPHWEWHGPRKEGMDHGD